MKKGLRLLWLPVHALPTLRSNAKEFLRALHVPCSRFKMRTFTAGTATRSALIQGTCVLPAICQE